jgi:hypothetical protein
MIYSPADVSRSRDKEVHSQASRAFGCRFTEKGDLIGRWIESGSIFMYLNGNRKLISYIHQPAARWPARPINAGLELPDRPGPVV